MNARVPPMAPMKRISPSVEPFERRVDGREIARIPREIDADAEQPILTSTGVMGPPALRSTA
jgi:hypothetical protein